MDASQKLIEDNNLKIDEELLKDGLAMLEEALTNYITKAWSATKSNEKIDIRSYIVCLIRNFVPIALSRAIRNEKTYEYFLKDLKKNSIKQFTMCCKLREDIFNATTREPVIGVEV